MRYITATAFVVLAILTGALGSFMHVQNDCDFPIYCIGSRSNDGIGDATETIEVPAGDSWRSPLEVLDNDYGSALKCSPEEDTPDDNQYQMEVNSNGKTWLDLSIVNGDPFTDYERAVYFSKRGLDCPSLECSPGDNSCEWCPEVGETICDPPNFITCHDTDADAWLYLCSYGD
ncbi:hypothetical protein VMCG_00856 [Cytospora schulzeri]|uniref:Secreted protein n=1 Tax=Cytospora schulzeri TaxID=448051 RepID=A0A423X4U4_9PEZI|nr:hypothetical protein VMCG_00856 [Valsa malicola]